MAENRNSERKRDEETPEDRPEEPGAEGGSKSPDADQMPGAPSGGSESAVGDTDQHSDA